MFHVKPRDEKGRSSCFLTDVERDEAGRKTRERYRDGKDYIRIIMLLVFTVCACMCVCSVAEEKTKYQARLRHLVPRRLKTAVNPPPTDGRKQLVKKNEEEGELCRKGTKK